MRTGRILPDQVSETVSVFPLPNYEERYNVSYVDLLTMKRYNNGVRIAPCLTPVNHRETIICYKDSTRKRYKSHTDYVPRPKPKSFSDTMIVYPKAPVKTFVTMLEYHIDECRKWFKTTVEFKARTYTTNKIVNNDQNETEELEDAEIDENFSAINDTNNNITGPGASQVFIPRWNKDVNTTDIHIPATGELIMNGF